MEFVDPPTKAIQERSDKWKEIVWELRHNRGNWGLVGNYSPGVATQIRRGKYKAFIAEDAIESAEVYMRNHWEITTRKTNNGNRNDIYIKWIG